MRGWMWVWFGVFALATGVPFGAVLGSIGGRRPGWRGKVVEALGMVVGVGAAVWLYYKLGIAVDGCQGQGNDCIPSTP